jgi:hypothetical protein
LFLYHPDIKSPKNHTETEECKLQCLQQTCFQWVRDEVSNNKSLSKKPCSVPKQHTEWDNDYLQLKYPLVSTKFPVMQNGSVKISKRGKRKNFRQQKLQRNSSNNIPIGWFKRYFLCYFREVLC